jgi:hypothetical protein
MYLFICVFLAEPWLGNAVTECGVEWWDDSEWRIDKDVEGSGCDIIEGTTPECSLYTEEKYENSQNSQWIGRDSNLVGFPLEYKIGETLLTHLDRLSG